MDNEKPYEGKPETDNIDSFLDLIKGAFDNDLDETTLSKLKGEINGQIIEVGEFNGLKSSPSFIANVIKACEKQGWIESVKTPNGETEKIKITPKGRSEIRGKKMSRFLSQDW